MSKENIDVILKSVEAVNRRDADAFVAGVSPDVQWETNPEMVGLGRIYRGRSGVREFFEQLFGLDFARARGRGSGVEPELHLWQVFWFAEGLITRRQAFWGRQEALEAAGLSE